MDRREAVRLLGAIAAVPFLPQTAEAATMVAARVHRVLQGAARFRTFDPAQQTLVTRLAEIIIPKTDTPGATDVRVAEFIDHIMTDWASESERRRLLEGLTEIDGRARQLDGREFAALAPERQIELARALDAERRAASGAGHAFGRIKSLTVFGYFTSEIVQRDVLKAQMIYPAYVPCAPV